MSLSLLPTNAVLINQVAVTVYGVAPGATLLANYEAHAKDNGIDATLNLLLNSAGLGTDANFNSIVLTNLGLSGEASAVAYMDSAVAANGRLATMKEAFSYLGSVAGQDNAYGAAGTTFNSKVTKAIEYSAVASNTTYSADAVSAASVAVGTTFALTTSADSATGTAGNDIFNASNAAGTAAGQTFNTGDVVAGGDGTDTLNITVGNAATYAASGVSGVETINGAFTAAGTLSMLGATGVSTVASAGSTANATYTNIAASTGLAMSNTDQSATFTFAAAAVSGSADEATLTVNNVAMTAAAGNETITVAGVETLNVVTTGAASVLDTLTAAAATTINVSGDQNINLGAANTVATVINAADLTGGLTVISNNAAAATVTGGAGNDTITLTEGAALSNKVDGGAGDDKITFTDNFAATDTAIGGDGTDTLVIDEDEASAYTTPTTRIVSGFEKVEIEGTLAGALTVANIQQGISELILDDGMQAVTITLEAGAQQVELEDVMTADGATFTDTGSAITDSLVLENGDAAASVFADKNIVVNGFETLTIKNTGSGAATTQDIGTLTVTPDTTGTATVLFTGSNAQTVEAITADVIDASGLTRGTGTVFDMTGTPVGVESITGSEGNDVLVGDASTNIIGGAGNDTITGGANNDTITGGEGVDSITSGAGNDTIDGGAGNDTLVLAGNLTEADTIDGGADTDTLSVNNAGLTALNALSVSNVLTLNQNISNVEKVLISDALNQGTDNFDMGRLDAIADVTLTSYTGAESVVGLAEGATVTMLAGDTAGASALTLALGVTSGTNTLNLNLTNDASTDFDAVTVASVENINITTAEATATSTVETHTVDLTATSLATLTVAGTESLNLYGVDLVASTINSSVGLGADLQSSGTGTTFTGSAKADAVAAGVGADNLTGGAGADDLSGGTGADTISGGAGVDTIAGGAGNDTIDLGEGDASSDVYTSRGGSGTTNIDTITNFTAGATAGDILALLGSTDSAAAFLNAGTVSVEEITTLTEAGDANDNVLLLSTGFYANAAAISAALASGGAITFGSGINGGVADVVLVYQATSGGDARVATAEIANAGGIVNVQDVAVLSGVTDITKLKANNFNLDDSYGSAGDDALSDTVGTGANAVYAGHGADTVTLLGGNDTVDLTESYQAVDAVTYGDDANVGAAGTLAAAQGFAMTGFVTAVDTLTLNGDFAFGNLTGTVAGAVNSVAYGGGVNLNGSGTGDDTVQVIAAGVATATAADLITIGDLQTAIGTITNEASGDERVLVFQAGDGSTALYKFVGADTANDIKAAELSLIGISDATINAADITAA